MNLSPYVMAGLKSQYMPGSLKTVKADEIIEATCTYFGIERSEISEKCKKRHIVYARQIAIYLLCYNTSLTLKRISELFGQAVTDHTTVIHARQKINDYLSQKLQKFDINKTKQDLINIEVSIL